MSIDEALYRLMGTTKVAALVTPEFAAKFRVTEDTSAKDLWPYLTPYEASDLSRRVARHLLPITEKDPYQP